MKVNDLKERLKHFREIAYDIQFQRKRLSDFNIKSKEQNLKRSDIKKELQDTFKIYDNEFKTLTEAILKLKNAETKIIFQLRYLHLKSWDEVNDFLYKLKDDYLIEKNSKYERRMYRLHNAGLKELINIFQNHY